MDAMGHKEPDRRAPVGLIWGNLSTKIMVSHNKLQSFTYRNSRVHADDKRTKMDKGAKRTLSAMEH